MDNYYYSSALIQYYDSPDYDIVFVFAQSASDQQQRVESIHCTSAEVDVTQHW